MITVALVSPSTQMARLLFLEMNAGNIIQLFVPSINAVIALALNLVDW